MLMKKLNNISIFYYLIFIKYIYIYIFEIYKGEQTVILLEEILLNIFVIIVKK